MTDDMRKEHVSCNICGSSENAVKFRKNSFFVVDCKDCGLVYVNPRYKKDILSAMCSNEVSPVWQYKETLPDDEKTFRNRIRLIERFLQKEKPVVLDIGCSVGTFMKEMRKKHWNVTGIDLDNTAVEYWRKDSLDAKCADFQETALPDSHFDIVIMNDFIELSHSPLQAFKKAGGHLKNNGLLFISTPDVEGVVAKISGKKWLHLKPDEHLYYFSRKTIKNILEKSGFKILWCGSLGRVRNLKTIFFKSQAYMPFLWKIVNKVNLGWILKKIAFNVNLGDEIGVIAKKVN